MASYKERKITELTNSIEDLKKSFGTTQRILAVILTHFDDGTIDISEEELVDDTVSYVISSETNEEEKKITLSVTKFDSSGRTEE